MENLKVIDSCIREGSGTRRILNVAMDVLSGRCDVEVVGQCDTYTGCFSSQIPHRIRLV